MTTRYFIPEDHFMIIPLEQLPTETLTAIIDEYILRESTDFGDERGNHQTKRAEVKRQLEQGTAVVVYSELHESVNILPSDQFNASIEEQG